MKHLLTLLILLFFSGSTLATDADEVEAILRLIAARRHQPKEVEPLKPLPSQPTKGQPPEGWHSEKGTDGIDYWVKDGYTLQKSSGVISHPFPSGAGTQATHAPTVVGVSSSSIVTTGTGRITIGVPTTGRSGVTNYPPSG